MTTARIIAGVGCRRDCPAEDIIAVIREATATAGCAVAALAVPWFKLDETGPHEAASMLGVPLVPVGGAALAAAEVRCATHSEMALHWVGFSSVAESAALAAAGPEARLVLPRIAGKRATCALAEAPAP